MRILFTLCLLLLFLSGFAQQTTTVPVNTSKSKIFIRCGSLSYNNEPLIIIDGVVCEDRKRIEDLMPIDIDSVWIIKDITAMAIYGSRASNGVIIITTKKAKLRTFIIKDFRDGGVIAGATISFISADKKDTLMYAADDKGMLVTDELKHGITYQMNVSSVNYKNFNQPYRKIYNLQQEEFLLERNIKTCDEVILTELVNHWGCGASGFTVTITTYDSSVTVPVLSGIKIYPNPLQRAGTVNLQLNNDGKNKTIRLISLDGKQLMQKPLPLSKGNIVFPLPTDSRFASGIYFVQVICEKGRVLASEKIIIQ